MKKKRRAGDFLSGAALEALTRRAVCSNLCGHFPMDQYRGRAPRDLKKRSGDCPLSRLQLFL
jgi:hypothetical protein